jgi:hypothetical protein
MSDGKARTFRITVGDAPARGLEFALSEDGESLTLVGMGSFTDKSLVIPESYGGMSVVSVASGAFVGRGVESLTISAALTDIAANNAFAGSFEGVTVTVDENNPVYRAEGNKIVLKESGKMVWGGSAFGDVNGEGSVSMRDVVELRIYLVSLDYETGESDLAVFSGADVNGDGTTNSSDLARLRQYFANYDYDNESPPFELGTK